MELNLFLRVEDETELDYPGTSYCLNCVELAIVLSVFLLLQLFLLKATSIWLVHQRLPCHWIQSTQLQCSRY
jgi:hypothetical protein